MTSTGSIPDLLKDITKRYDVRIGSMSDVVDDVVGLTTGNLAIDYLTGVGGLPLGRSVELYGLASSGKTTTATQAAARLQSKIISEGRDEYILYLDYEHALDRDYASALGLDVDHNSFLLVQPDWLEQGAEVALKLIATGKVRLCIWDSVASMTPKALIDGDFDQRTNAMNRARLMSGLLQRINSLLHEQNCCAVFVNHLMEAVEMSGRPGMPPRTTTPGGKALKYYASVRLEYKQIKNIKGKASDSLSATTTDQVIATHVKVKVTKNKVGPPFREAEVRVRFGLGFDNAWSAVQVLTAHKQVVVAAGHYYFDHTKVPALVHPEMAVSATGRPTIHGEAALLAFADAHPVWRELLIAHAVVLVEQYGGTGLVTDSLDEDQPFGTDLDLSDT